MAGADSFDCRQRGPHQCPTCGLIAMTHCRNCDVCHASIILIDDPGQDRPHTAEEKVKILEWWTMLFSSPSNASARAHVSTVTLSPVSDAFGAVTGRPAIPTT